MSGIERNEGDPITVRTEYASVGGDPFVVVEVAGLKGATTALGMRREEAAELRDALTRELDGPQAAPVVA